MISLPEAEVPGSLNWKAHLNGSFHQLLEAERGLV